MEPVIVGAFPKNKTEVVAGEISEFNGKVYAHIRVFRPTFDGSFAHTPKGVAMPLTCLPEVQQAVHRLVDVIGPNVLTGRIDLGREQLRIGTRLYEENMYLDVRRFYQKDGKWVPGPKGVMVRPELLEQLVNLVNELVKEAASVGPGDEG